MKVKPWLVTAKVFETIISFIDMKYDYHGNFRYGIFQ